MMLFLTVGVTGLSVLLTPAATRFFGRNAGWPLAALYLLAAAIFAPAALEVFAGKNPSWVVPWVPDLGLYIDLRADGLGVVFANIALLIGAVVFLYSTRYLAKSRQLSFYLLMTAFTFSMLILVLANDLVLLFIAWELTSLASFLLIARSGIHGEGASMRTLLITFIGGLLLLAAVSLIWAKTESTSLTVIFNHEVWATDSSFTTTIAVLIAISVFTKSAQFPFHIWLPDAMAAITPVSAYLHAAAVVKAGIFLLLRFSPLFYNNLVWNILLVVIGLFTSVIAAIFAIQQTDLKKLMAYSTVSQLGLIVATIGVGTAAALAAAVLHVIAHALFKSGLFMMVGVIDHSVGTRDLRRMPPKLYKLMPVSFTVTTIGAASMAGIPPMMGFISKEEILTALSNAPGSSWSGWAALTVASLGAVLTLSYCAKIVLGTFFDGTDDDHKPHHFDEFLIITAGFPIMLSVPLALRIAVFDKLIAVAATAATTAEQHPHFKLWHGFNLEFGITLAVLFTGAVVIWYRKAIFGWAERVGFPFTGADVINLIEKILRKSGTYLDGLVSGYYATRHVLAILLSFGALGVGGVLILLGAGLPDPTPNMTKPIDVILLVIITFAVISITRTQSRLAATVALSAVGISMTVQILALGAPDVALTQLLVESLGIIVIMLVLQKLPLKFKIMTGRAKRSTVIISLFVGLGAALLVWALNGRREKSELARYYLDNSQEVAGGTNVVNTILVEFRALDTMGELAVLGMAGVAIIAVLSAVRDRHLDPEGVEERQVPQPDLALRSSPSSTAYRAIRISWPNVIGMQLMLRFINPILIFISVMLFFRGHNSPGGGFIAALVASSIAGLIYLSTSNDHTIGPPRLPLFLIGGGIVLAVTTGLVGGLVEGSFLQPIHGEIFHLHVTSSMIFDVGVYMAVVGLITVTFNVLGTASESLVAGEATRERVDEAVEGELAGPLETVRGETKVAVQTRFLFEGEPPREVGQ